MEDFNQKLLISIAIPCYDQRGKNGEFLDFSFRKIASQSYRNLEVVISDESTNGLVSECCKKWEDRLTIKYFRNPQKPGSNSRNMNNALRHCSGDLIKMLFMDDFLYDEHSIENIVDAYDYKHSWIISGSTHSSDGVNFFNPMHPKYNHYIYYGFNPIGSPSVLTIVNRNIIFFDENLMWLMDCDYYKRLFSKFGEPLILNKITICNRISAFQATSTVCNDALRRREAYYMRKKYMLHAILHRIKTLSRAMVKKLKFRQAGN